MDGADAPESRFYFWIAVIQAELAISTLR